MSEYKGAPAKAQYSPAESPADDNALTLVPEALPQTIRSLTAPRWGVHNGEVYARAPFVTDTIPPGLYKAGVMNQVGPVLVAMRTDTDHLIPLPDSRSEEVVQEIVEFWQLKEEFAKRGLTHKRGVLMYGPPGSGKTATIHQLIKYIIEKHDGVCVYLEEPEIAAAVLQMLRSIEPHRPVICLLEDFDALLRKYSESLYLSLLDGEAQVGNIVFVATTNYPEQIPDRFKDRPSRFDLVIEVGPPNAAARHLYLLTKEPSLEANGEIKRWVSLTEGFSIAHLRELIILCRCYKKPFGVALERLEAMRDNKATSGTMDDGKRGTAGFTGGPFRRVLTP